MGRAGSCAALRDIMAGSGTAQDRLDRIVRVVAAEMVAEVCSAYIMRAGEVFELFATEGLRPEAVHRTRLRVGEGLVGVIAATARPLALADAQAHPEFRLSAGNRRRELSLADGRSDPARRPGARRAGRAEPHSAPLHRGRDRDAADDRDDRRRARRERRSRQPAGNRAKPRRRDAAGHGSSGSGSMPAWRSGRRCCTSPEWSFGKSVAEDVDAELVRLRHGGRGDARGDRRAGRDQPRVRRRRASRGDRDLSHVRRRPRLGGADRRRSPQRPDRRGGGAEGRRRHARSDDAGQRPLSARAPVRSGGSRQPTAAASFRDVRRAPPGRNCLPSSSLSRGRWGRPS